MRKFATDGDDIDPNEEIDEIEERVGALRERLEFVADQAGDEAARLRTEIESLEARQGELFELVTAWIDGASANKSVDASEHLTALDVELGFPGRTTQQPYRDGPAPR